MSSDGKIAKKIGTNNNQRRHHRHRRPKSIVIGESAELGTVESKHTRTRFFLFRWIGWVYNRGKSSKSRRRSNELAAPDGHEDRRRTGSSNSSSLCSSAGSSDCSSTCSSASVRSFSFHSGNISNPNAALINREILRQNFCNRRNGSYYPVQSTLPNSGDIRARYPNLFRSSRPPIISYDGIPLSLNSRFAPSSNDTSACSTITKRAHVRGKRRAPEPPPVASQLTQNAEQQLQLARKRRPAPQPPTRSNYFAQMNGNSPSMMPRPWYKRAASQERVDQQRASIRRSVDVARGIAMMSSSRSKEGSLTSVSSTATDTRNGLALLANISALDKEAADIVRNERARNRMIMTSSQRERDSEQVQKIVDSLTRTEVKRDKTIDLDKEFSKVVKEIDKHTSENGIKRLNATEDCDLTARVAKVLDILNIIEIESRRNSANLSNSSTEDLNLKPSNQAPLQTSSEKKIANSYWFNLSTPDGEEKLLGKPRSSANVNYKAVKRDSTNKVASSVPDSKSIEFAKPALINNFRATEKFRDISSEDVVKKDNNDVINIEYLNAIVQDLAPRENSLRNDCSRNLNSFSNNFNSLSDKKREERNIVRGFSDEARSGAIMKFPTKFSEVNLELEGKYHTDTIAVNRLFRKLERAIASGNHRRASILAKELAQLKISCSVFQQRRDKLPKDLHLNMYIEDKQAHQGPIPLRVPENMSVAQLKAKIFVEFEIPVDVQRWIIGKNLVDNDEFTLKDLRALEGSPVFLYLIPSTESSAEPKVPNDLAEQDELQALANAILEGGVTADRGKLNDESFKTSEETINAKSEPSSSSNGGTDSDANFNDQTSIAHADLGAKSIFLNATNQQAEHDVSPMEKLMRYNELVSLENQHVISNIEPVECPICFTLANTGDAITLRDCLHTFCRTCLSNTIFYCEEAEVKCPYGDAIYTCDSTLQEREIKAIVAPDVYQQHLAKSLALAETNAGKNSFHCKTPDCPGWCFYDDNVNNFACPVCNCNNCLTCQVIHEGQNCRQYQEKLKFSKETDKDSKITAAMLEEMVDRGEALSCPTCEIVLMKKWGCDWLRCSMCKTEICWVTKGPRWGPGGKGDTSGGCRCGENGIKCHPDCNYCH